MHGLRGNRYKTWTSGDTFWPRDLLAKSMKNVRIITYGYDADIVRFLGKASANISLQHAENLIQDLHNIRKTKEQVISLILFKNYSI